MTVPDDGCDRRGRRCVALRRHCAPAPDAAAVPHRRRRRRRRGDGRSIATARSSTASGRPTSPSRSTASPARSSRPIWCATRAPAAAVGAGRRAIPTSPATRPAAAGRTILLVIDYVSLRVESRTVLDTAEAWVATLGPTDRVGLMALPQPGLNIEFTTDHARVDRGARQDRAASPTRRRPSVSATSARGKRSGCTEGDTFIRSEVLTPRVPAASPTARARSTCMVRSMQMDMQSTVLPVVRSLRGLVQGDARAARPEARPAAVVRVADVRARRGDRDRARGRRRGAAPTSRSTRSRPSSWEQRRRGRGRRPDVLQDRDLLMSTVETLSGMTGGRAVRLAGKADLAFASLTAGLGGYYRLGVRHCPKISTARRTRSR